MGNGVICACLTVPVPQAIAEHQQNALHVLAATNNNLVLLLVIAFFALIMILLCTIWGLSRMQVFAPVPIHRYTDSRTALKQDPVVFDEFDLLTRPPKRHE